MCSIILSLLYNDSVIVIQKGTWNINLNLDTFSSLRLNGVVNGVKQGGVLSPLLFADIIIIMKEITHLAMSDRRVPHAWLCRQDQYFSLALSQACKRQSLQDDILTRLLNATLSLISTILSMLNKTQTQKFFYSTLKIHNDFKNI